MNMDVYTLFISSLLDGSVRPFVYYNNRAAAEAHRAHINKAIATHNPLQAGKAFVRKTSHFVRSNFGEG